MQKFLLLIVFLTACAAPTPLTFDPILVDYKVREENGYASAPQNMCQPFLKSFNRAVVTVTTNLHNDKNESMLCSGVVVTNSLVYTAKHCIDINEKTTLSVKFDGSDYAVLRYDIDAIFDIALLHLEQPLFGLKTINVSTDTLEKDQYYNGQLIGFGCVIGERLERPVIYFKSSKTNAVDILGCVCHGDSGGAILDKNGNLVALTISTMQDGRTGRGQIVTHTLSLQ